VFGARRISRARVLPFPAAPFLRNGNKGFSSAAGCAGKGGHERRDRLLALNYSPIGCWMGFLAACVARWFTRRAARSSGPFPARTAAIRWAAEEKGAIFFGGFSLFMALIHSTWTCRAVRPGRIRPAATPRGCARRHDAGGRSGRARLRRRRFARAGFACG
jgi:hypothetical protein